METTKVLILTGAVFIVIIVSCFANSGENVLPYVLVSVSDRLSDVQCQSEAIECTLPKESGRKCKSGKEKWYFSVRQGQCNKFTYYGCGGNSNRFSSYSECRRKCSCQADINHGVYCDKKYVMRYFWETSSKMCRKFWFSGCKGNENRYRTISQCKRVCN